MGILNEYTRAKIFLLGISKRKYSRYYVKGLKLVKHGIAAVPTPLFANTFLCQQDSKSLVHRDRL